MRCLGQRLYHTGKRIKGVRTGLVSWFNKTARFRPSAKDVDVVYMQKGRRGMLKNIVVNICCNMTGTGFQPKFGFESFAGSLTTEAIVHVE